MKKFLSASEISALELKGLPRSKASILSRAKAENWEFKEETGLGGIRYVFLVPEKYFENNPAQFSVAETKAEYSVVNKLAPNTYSKNYNHWKKEQDKSDIVPIGYFKNAIASSGSQHFLEIPHSDTLWFKSSFIQKLQFPEERLICIEAKGNSMQPTINNGDIIMFYLTGSYDGEGIYLLNQGDEVTIKRLLKLTSDKILVISDNKELYPPTELNLSKMSTTEFNVIGKCVWRASTVT